MASASKKSRHLQPLSTNFHIHNRSFSSIATDSDAGTFHSAHAHPVNMEMRPISQPGVASHTYKRPISPSPVTQPNVESIKMDRQDSGFHDGITLSRHTSSSSRTRRPSPSKTKRRPTNSSTTPSTRPSTKRTSRSSTSAITQTQARASTSSGRRPTLHTRHTLSQQPSHTQFFHFPTLTDPQPDSEAATIPPPPPPTVHYWTSDSTRRLEYAAIDAASQGLKGFFIKLVPDCVLPASSRRTRFSGGGEDNDSDLGSVRRYRLELPEEKDSESATHGGESRSIFRPRWATIFGRRRGSC